MGITKPFKKIKKHFKKKKELAKQCALAYNTLSSIAIERSLNELLANDERYHDKKNLNRFEYKVYSQHGEDGIIAEIFNRIGVTNRFFVEFGASNGLENNTAYLLVKGFKGVWIESDAGSVSQIQKKFSPLIANNTLTVLSSFVTRENIEALFREANVPAEFDLLSIDIDGNDYWIWNAVTHYKPRVVVIEYNAMFSPDVQWVIKYNPHYRWNGSSYFGASLKSMQLLAEKKGYRLVACELTGVNAFFVRTDCINDRFQGPFTAQNHYQSPRYHLVKKEGFSRDFGEFEAI